MKFLEENLSDFETRPNSTEKGIPHRIRRDGKNIICVVTSATLKIELTEHFKVVDAMEMASRLEEAEESNTEIYTSGDGETFYLEIPSEIEEIPSFYFCGEQFWVEYTKKSLLRRIELGFLTGKTSCWVKLYHFRLGSMHIVKICSDGLSIIPLQIISTGGTIKEMVHDLQSKCEDKGIRLIGVSRV